MIIEKPKEFWIIEKEHDPDQVVYANYPGAIRVVEYDAYEKAIDLLRVIENMMPDCGGYAAPYDARKLLIELGIPTSRNLGSGI